MLKQILAVLAISLNLAAAVHGAAHGPASGGFEGTLPSAIGEKANDKVCAGDLVLDQETLSGLFWSEANCENCGEGQQVEAEDFFVAEDTLVTEVVLWGVYFPGNTPPSLENWTVLFHQDSLGSPGATISSEIVGSASRISTGRTVEVGDGFDEYRWVLRLKKPVRLGGGAFYWIEAFHDSPVASADVALLTGTSDPMRGRSGSSFSTDAAPGATWLQEGADHRIQICGTDARWDGLLVPHFELDTSNPQDRTLLGVRNTAETTVSVDVAYYSVHMSNGPLRVDRRDLGPNQTMTLNVGSDVSDLDPNDDGLINGFIVVSEEGGGAENLTGDFFRIDFGNDFATGGRLLPFDGFCQTQEVRFLDFGSGSEFNIVLRNPTLGEFAFEVSVLDEQGNVQGGGGFVAFAQNGKLTIGDLIEDLNFGTLVFDFSASGGGVVTGRYSAFGKFSAEVNSACRDGV